jgi:hypothetical protein
MPVMTVTNAAISRTAAVTTSIRRALVSERSKGADAEPEVLSTYSSAAGAT